MRNRYYLLYNRKNSKRLEFNKKYNKIQLRRLKPAFFMEIGVPMILTTNIDDALTYSSLKKLIKDYIYPAPISDIYNTIITSDEMGDMPLLDDNDGMENDEFDFEFDPLTEEEIQDEIFSDNINQLLSEYIDVLVKDKNDHYYIMDKLELESKIYDTHEENVIKNSSILEVYTNPVVLQLDKYIKYILDSNKNKIKNKLILLTFSDSSVFQISTDQSGVVKYGANKKDDHLCRLTLRELYPGEILSIQVFMDINNIDNCFVEQYSFINNDGNLQSLSAQETMDNYTSNIEHMSKSNPEFLSEDRSETLKGLSIFCDVNGGRLMH